MVQQLKIDGERLYDSIIAIGEVGATPGGGSCRVAFSPEDRQGRDLFRRWCETAGMSVAVDTFGNMFARRRGTDAVASPVVIGSHLDTQPTGGRFDGVFGVLSGLEIVRSLNDADATTRRPIEIVNWTNEEGALFRPLMGSDVFTGRLSLAEALAMRDVDGRRCGDLLEAIGYRGDAEPSRRSIHCYFEAHIEQGPILEAEAMQVGIVTNVIGLRRYAVTITGREAHAGTTPMSSRRDAMVSAARAILAGTAMAKNIPDARASFGALRAHPGVSNTLAGRVELSVDLRHADPTVLDRMEAEFTAAIATADAAEGTSSRIERSVAAAAMAFDAELCACLEAAAASLGYRHRRMASGALHDACAVAHIAPAAMVFVPCRDGISHNEAEYASPEACFAGCAVLAQAVAVAAGIGKAATEFDGSLKVPPQNLRSS